MLNICIPVYNGGEKMLSLIDSLNHQSIQNFKVFLFDNCSTDNTNDICQVLSKDSKFIHIRRKRNIGPYRNIAKAIATQYEGYFALIADDMRLEPTYLERCLDVYESSPDVSHVYTGVYLWKGEHRHRYIDNYRLNQENVDDRLISLAKSLTVGTAIYGVFRASCTSLLDGYWPTDSFMRLGDSMILSMLANEGKIIQINDALIHRNIADKYVNFNGRLENFFYGGYKRLSMPFVTGIYRHYQWLMGEECRSSNKVKLANTVSSIMLNRYQVPIDREIERLWEYLSVDDIFHTWDGSHLEIDELRDYVYLDILKYSKYLSHFISRKTLKKISLHCLEHLLKF